MVEAPNPGRNQIVRKEILISGRNITPILLSQACRMRPLTTPCQTSSAVGTLAPCVRQHLLCANT